MELTLSFSNYAGTLWPPSYSPTLDVAPPLGALVHAKNEQWLEDLDHTQNLVHVTHKIPINRMSRIPSDSYIFQPYLSSLAA